MPANSKVATRMPHASTDAAQVAILMCTKNGEAFLDEQLKSIAEQTHANWTLFVSDDGSTDATGNILKRFAAIHEQKTVVRNGPGKGVCANFLSLATDSAIDADYFAISDQDDVWYKDKLARADLARNRPGRRAGILLRPHRADIERRAIIWLFSAFQPPDSVPQRPHPESRRRQHDGVQ
jgi:glycosyltransferase involved in cell wall biosynthesis